MWMVHERTLRRWKRMQQTQFRNDADTTRQRAFLDHLASDFNRNKLVFVGEAAFFTNRCCWQCQALLSFLIWYAPSSTWTSKLHLDCRFRMQNMISWKMAKWKGDTEPRERKVKVHSVLHCPNSECHGMTVNRDTNAARNMLQLLLDRCRGLERQICFRRGTPVTDHAHRQCRALPERARALLPL
ncbi:hypothetical protein EDD86DRAFT_51237 [Gorgonomyces haynaldii]|nr:hypothetical protein EDD86DRAFT_51237 [Gorgonomyces haynaldii]